MLIAATAKIEAFIKKSVHLAATSAAAFYVAVTRAEQSVAIILDSPDASALPVWTP
ncbi:hypothetical protein [Pseudomonas aeruginosa]|uniref:hypothetical protein n=1 Tax=Pseudomonas aeruginosa TaxID=287 RepID=UPI000A79722C|nr:hypothetical protein [Pseudomonas aeruginosa]MCT5064327.1 hypothetical protein [Pseudomonas aeruginosa]MCU9466623.1 hypothetical protein [Pseudomonas aeruginosa]MCU9497792.1 hypothetical protein [Pseudomonas aeruginosa]MCZ9743419.1 hypothetical protein [Pseudomonas aeruginosa]MDK3035141.1 hypothetical protein [Pseudomonas aeruginosa]